MKKKVITLQFQHETNTFSSKSADEQAFKNLCYAFGAAAFESQRGTDTELASFVNVLGGLDDVELIPTVAATANPCGPVTASVYDSVVRAVTDAIRENAPIDGVLFELHGAMVAEGHEDGEGDLLEAVRRIVGKGVPIISSLDLHANVTAKMAKNADALIPYEMYPHTDRYQTGAFAAELTHKTLCGEVKPTMAYRRVPYLLPMFPTERPEIAPLYKLAKELEARDGVISVRFAHGFFPSDIAEMGMSVMVVTDGDRELADEIADQMAAAIEAATPTLKREFISLDEALDRAELSGEGPIVIADASDNPGGGAIGDTTHILRRILERSVTGAAIATILDPESVEKCVAAGVGATVELELGGKSDPTYSGGPIGVSARVIALSDGKYVFKGKMSHGEIANHGKTAVVDVAGNTVLITTFPRQPYDLEIFRAHGIAPEKQKILVTKSAVHYRASYVEVAREMHAVCLPGLAVPVPTGYEFKNWKNK